MKTGAVSAALAVATLLTSTASAAPDHDLTERIKERSVSDEIKRSGYSGFGNTGDQRNDYRPDRSRRDQSSYRDDVLSQYRPGSNGYHSAWGRDRHGMNRSHHGWISGYDRQNAIRSCARAIQLKTDRIFPGPSGRSAFAGMPSVERGRYGKIKVVAPVKLEARGTRAALPASCEIRDGRVVDLDYNPERYVQNRVHHGFGWSFGKYWRR